MDFEPGSIVALKSGGPPLTVVATEGDQVRVLWFAQSDDRLQEAHLPTACLEPVSDFGDDFEEEPRQSPLPPIAPRR